MSSEEWAKALLANSLDTIKGDLARVYSGRATFLSKLAAVTTKRLQAIRSLSDDLKNKRKSDVTPEILERMLLTRSDMTEAFVSEILTLDPTGDLFLKEWASGSTLTRLMTDKSSVIMDEIKRTLRIEIAREGFYANLQNASAAQLAQITAYRERITEEARAREAWLGNLKQRYGDETIKKWSANLRSFKLGDAIDIKDTTESKRKGKMPYKGIVPHETSKPGSSAVSKKKAKLKDDLGLNPKKTPTRSISQHDFGLTNYQTWIDWGKNNNLSPTEMTVLLCELAIRSGKTYPDWYTPYQNKEGLIIGNDGVDLPAVKQNAEAIERGTLAGGVRFLENYN